MPTLELHRVAKTYGSAAGPVRALDELSVVLEDGEFVSVVGASGCGKTTLLRLVAGLEAPTSGRILLAGEPVAGPGPERGVVFQSDTLLPWRTVLGNVQFGLELRRVPRAARHERARRYLDLVGLAGVERRYPHELSGGMRQRVNLARALAVDPAVLLLDEPFAALDAQTRELLQEELLAIWHRQRKTVIFITHQLDEAVFLSDRVLVLSGRPGRLVADIAITLPRPRSLAVKRHPEFIAAAERLRTLIEHDARRQLGGAPYQVQHAWP